MRKLLGTYGRDERLRSGRPTIAAWPTPAAYSKGIRCDQESVCSTSQDLGQQPDYPLLLPTMIGWASGLRPES